MGRKRHSKESIIETLRNLAKKLGKPYLRKQDVQSVLSPSVLTYHFGSLGNALEAAGLERRSCTDHLKEGGGKVTLTHDDLFRSMLDVEQDLGHEPSGVEYESNGEYSTYPFRRRFGKWRDVLAHYRKWKSDKGAELADTQVNANQEQRTAPILPPRVANSRSIVLAESGSSPAQLYGEPIDFRGLRHAPINEQGVVYLFGMVSRELGFYIEAIQQGFPDCEGKYLHNAKKNLWAKARIEFEFKASNFQEHGHDLKQCDVIVCWINDWQDCPITVIELKQELLKLPQA